MKKVSTSTMKGDEKRIKRWRRAGTRHTISCAYEGFDTKEGEHIIYIVPFGETVALAKIQ